MSLLDLTLGSEPRAGNLTAWFLAFHEAATGSVSPADEPVKIFGSDKYHAEITAGLTSGLTGGSFSITIEGLTDDDYAAIRRGEGSPAFAKLYLGWADTNSSVSGYLASALGLPAGLPFTGEKPPPSELLVAVLAVDAVSRKAGTRRYEATITGRDWIFARLVRSRTSKKAVRGATRTEALRSLLEGTVRLRDKKDFKLYQPTPAPGASPPASGAKPEIVLPGESSALDILKIQVAALEVDAQKYGRGMALLRDGMLHLGPRPIPFDGKAKPLTLAGGLIESAPVKPDDTESDVADEKKERPRQFKLTLKGRPDLKPGDTVEFEPSAEDVLHTKGGVLGAIGDLFAGPLVPSMGSSGKPITLYVTSVQHRLGRTSGFVTTLTGIELKKGKTWDLDRTVDPQTKKCTPDASAELEAARTIADTVRCEIGNRAGTEVAEVRGAAASGTGEPPGQTVELWRGLLPGDSLGYGARRGDIRRPSLSPTPSAPYLTPFAYGKCGLVLPRYPGTRVAVIHRNGQSDDPIDAGALWPSGRGPDKAEAGDWWLSLPAAVPAAQRTRLEDSETPADYAGKVTQDLIDADGNRVIEVGELTIRVGRNVLKSAGQRPSRGSTQDAITIEHADGGAMLVLNSDGSIRITGKNIELDAGSGKITLKASQVDVA